MNSIEFGDELLEKFFELDDPQKERELFWTVNHLEPHFSTNHPYRTRRDEIWRALFWGKPILGNPWKNRLNLWATHIDRYVEIKNGQQKPSLGAERLDKLNVLLTILDQKVGMTLSSSSLLLAGVAFFVSLLPALTEWIKIPVWLGSAFLLGFYLLVFVILIFCLLAIWFSLRGFRRVVWGDLGLSKKETPEEREAEYAAFLIISVARRTNMFRAATVMIRRAIQGLFIFAVLAGALLIIRTVTTLGHQIAGRSAKLQEERDIGPVEMNGSTLIMPGASLSVTNADPQPGTVKDRARKSKTAISIKRPQKDPAFCPCVPPQKTAH